jgi:hypothetical protein
MSLPYRRDSFILTLFCALTVLGAARTAQAQDEPRRPRDLGRIQDDELDEASGLVVGRLNPNVLWAHNDSGDSARLFAIDLEGRTVARVALEGARSRDWEDLAIASPGGRPTLYVGDIGDNRREHEQIRVYRLPEPRLPDSSASGTPELLTIERFDEIVLTYPDGPRNAETLLVDPQSGDVIIVTKGSTRPEVYRAALPGTGNGRVTLRLVGRLTMDAIPFGDDEIEGAVGGDLSADGRFALVKSYLRIYRWTWDGTADMPFTGDPESLPYVPEPQGEAVAISADGRTYFTLSERVGDRIPRLYAYDRR